MSWLGAYFMAISDKIEGTLFFFAALSICSFAAYLAIALMIVDGNWSGRQKRWFWRKHIKRMRWLIISFLFFLSAFVFCPTRKIILTTAFFKYGADIAKSEGKEALKSLDKSLMVLNQKLAEILEKTRKDEKNVYLKSN